MDVSRINEIKILSNVRLISSNVIAAKSKENLNVAFQISGDILGQVICYLCLDGHELEPTNKNYIFPLFVEAMNILVGKQLSQDQNLKNFKTKLSPPKLSMISKVLSTKEKNLHSYELELEGFTFTILTEYNLEVVS